MKKSLFLIPLTCAALALAPFAANAADDDSAPKPPPQRERSARAARAGGQRFQPVQLTTEESQKLRAALQKARKAEKVVEAQKKAREAQKAAADALKAAVLEADPSLKDVVKKYGDRPIGGFGGFGQRPEGGPPTGEARARRQGARRAAPPPPAPGADNL